MFFRPGDAGASGGREIRFQTVSPLLGLWSERALERDFQVFGDREAFLAYYGNAAPDAAGALCVDFDRSYLIGIQQGLCPTGGYSIRVKDVRARQSAVTVTVDFQEPEPGDIVTMAMTTPHLFLVVPRPRGTREPAFQFRSADGALLAERRPLYGGMPPDADSRVPSSPEEV